MIYSFDFFTHDENEKYDDSSNDNTHHIDEYFDSDFECPDPFSEFEPSENHTILFNLVNIYLLNLTCLILKNNIRIRIFQRKV